MRDKKKRSRNRTQKYRPRDKSDKGIDNTPRYLGWHRQWWLYRAQAMVFTSLAAVVNVFWDAQPSRPSETHARFFVGFKALALLISTVSGAIGVSIEIFSFLASKYVDSPGILLLSRFKVLFGILLGTLASALILAQEKGDS